VSGRRAGCPDGFSISNCVRRVKAARRCLGPNVELMIDAHGSLEVATAIKQKSRARSRVRLSEGRFTQMTAATQAWRPEPLFMPQR
jgi:hypothetical protein